VKVSLVTLGGFMALVVGIPAVVYIVDPALKVQNSEGWISAGPMENYPPEIPTLFPFTQSKQNGWERTVNSYAVYVIKHSATDATVFSNRCTHLSCRVRWDEQNEEYICPCHDGIFNKDGQVVSGPPPKPLIAYETKVEEGILYFYFSEA
jgi:menaquinol-cytochrome c reductase iron-sulfur subunit